MWDDFDMAKELHIITDGCMQRTHAAPRTKHITESDLAASNTQEDVSSHAACYCNWGLPLAAVQPFVNRRAGSEPQHALVSLNPWFVAFQALGRHLGIVRAEEAQAHNKHAEKTLRSSVDAMEF